MSKTNIYSTNNGRCL